MRSKSKNPALIGRQILQRTETVGWTNFRDANTFISIHKTRQETKEIKTQEDLIWLRYSENNENKRKIVFYKKCGKREFRTIGIITYAQISFFFWVKNKKRGKDRGKKSWSSLFFMIEKLNKFSRGCFGYRSFFDMLSNGLFII